MQAFIDQLPKHEAGLHLAHNPHREFYQSVADYTVRDDGLDDFVSKEERARAIEQDELWELHWYPDTPVGFHRRYASTLEAVLP